MENNFFTIVIVLCGVILVGSITLLVLKKKKKKTSEVPDLDIPDEPLAEVESIPEIEEPTIEVMDEVGYANGDITLEAPDPLKTQLITSPKDFLKTQRIDNSELMETQIVESPVEDSPKTRMMNAVAPTPVAEIDILINDQVVRTHKLIEGDLTIGRDPAQAQIIIPELIVSKVHCTLSVKGDIVKIIDNGSTNGVYVDGEKVHELELTDDIFVFLGKKGTVKLVCRKL